MFDPWVVIDAALEAANPPITVPHGTPARIGDVDIGDIAICIESSGRLRRVFYDFLVSSGYALTEEERAIFKVMKNDRREFSRPCVVLERHSDHSFKVCFIAALADDSNSSVFTSLSIPYGEKGLRSYPFNRPPQPHAVPVEPCILAMPVIRSRVIPVYRRSVRERLDYGELERAKTLIQAKVELFTARHEEIRAQELMLHNDPRHHANKVKEEPPPPPPPPVPLFYPGRRRRFYHANSVSMFNSRFIPSRVYHYNDMQWVLKHAPKDIAAASRYLSSVEPPPSPPFYLPRPFYSTLLRASAAFVRRGIFP
ncbi:hypothetical protein K438DRAFT_1747778 [Mycena galopus ATCC 62051]|nr:hypothetical protein K438DRAFT_1747778 [Mycena galopus ATCC 62051]